MKSLTLSILLVPVLTAGCDQPNEFAPPPPPTVTVMNPPQRDVTVFEEFTGRTAAIEDVDIRARVQGFLESMEFEGGDVVREGELLFTIQPEQYEAAKAYADAELAQRSADLALAETELKLVERVAREGAASEIEQERSAAERDVAAARVIGAEAAVTDAQINLDYTKIHAPIAGRISRNYVDPGNLVGAGEATLLATIVHDDPLYVYGTIDERTVIGFMAEGRPEQKPEEARRPLGLRRADGTEYGHIGRADMIDTRVDPETGTLQFRALFPNPDGELLPGIFVRILVPSPVEQAILVPEIALQRDLVGDYALVVNGEGVVERRDVRRGRKVERMRIIEEGLTPEDRVIVRGLQRARVGITVNAVEETGESPSSGASG